ncbi:MAG: alpha/beta hydrolase [Pseudomonadota bacterium]|nr:alpha/beta hydrolase [Pseudomonadota bacterium]
MASFQYNNLSVNFVTQGVGPAVILLHAGGSSSAQWRKTAAALEESFRLIMPDFIGYGRTDNWIGPEPPSHDDQANMIAALVEQECDGPIHIVAHSFGGAVAARLVLSRPDLLRRLVLIEPVLTPLLNLAGRQDVFAEYRNLAETFIDNARSGREVSAWRYFIDYRNGAGSWDNLSDEARERFLAGTNQVVETYLANLANPTTLEDCRTIVAPTLIVCGEKTTEPDRIVTEILYRELPNGRYHILPGAEHMSPLTHPDIVAAAVRGHLKDEED